MNHADTILVVDDDESTREVLSQMLTPAYDVLCACGGEEALTIMSSGAVQVSLVLLDLMMSGIDGFTVLERMRADAALTAIPVIVVTAREDDESRERALSLGAQDLLNKPLQASVVLLRVERTLRICRLDEISADWEQARQASRYVRQLEETLDDSPCALCQLVLGNGTDVAYANKRFFHLRGETRRNRMADARTLLWRTMCPDDLPLVQQTIQAITHGSATEQALRYRLIRKDGQVVQVQAMLYAHQLADCWTLRLVEIDVTRQQRRDSSFRRLLERLPGGMVIVRLDADMTVLTHNPGFLHLAGLADDRLDSLTLRTFFREKTASLRAEFLSEDGQPQSTELTLYRPGGEEVPVLLSGVSDLSVQPTPLAYCQLLDVTVQTRSREALEQAMHRQVEQTAILNAFISKVLPMTAMTAWRLDVRSRQMACLGKHPDPRWQAAFAHLPESLLSSDLLLPEDHLAVQEACRRLVKGERELEVVVCVRRGAEVRHIRMTLSRIPDAEVYIGLSEDITERVLAEQGLKRERKFREAMVSGALVSFEIDLTADVFLQADHALLHRLSLPEDVPYTAFLRTMAGQALHPVSRMEFLDRMNAATLVQGFVRGTQSVQFDACMLLGAEDQPLWTTIYVHLIRDESSGHVNMSCRMLDVDASKRSQLALQERAQRDALTGLYNRAAFEHIVRERLAVCCAGCGGALLMLDVDNFKQVNDHYGHQTGDHVLTSVAAHVRSVFRAGDVIGRMGGDELSVFMPDCSNRAIVQSRTEQLLHNVSTDDTLPGITLSVGIAYIPEAGATFPDIYAHADKALYVSKNRGKNAASVWTKDEA